MTPEEFQTLQAGDKIRHVSSNHTLRIIEVYTSVEEDTVKAIVERNFHVVILPLNDWQVASQPRLK